MNTVLRLGDGETSLLAGLINEVERTSLTGTPGLASVPLIGRLFSANKKEIEETDIVLTLTPRIIRHTDVSLEDLLPHVIDGLSGSGVLYEPQPAPRRDPADGERRPQGPNRDPKNEGAERR